MPGERNITQLLKNLNPRLNEGEYVFTTVMDPSVIDRSIPLCEIKEEEGVTLVVTRPVADEMNLSYDFIASWITLTVQSSLEAVGLTALVSSALAKHNVSCNMVAGYYHDHLFIEKKDAEKVLHILKELQEKTMHPE